MSSLLCNLDEAAKLGLLCITSSSSSCSSSLSVVAAAADELEKVAVPSMVFPDDSTLEHKSSSSCTDASLPTIKRLLAELWLDDRPRVQAAMKQLADLCLLPSSSSSSSSSSPPPTAFQDDDNQDDSSIQETTAADTCTTTGQNQMAEMHRRNIYRAGGHATIVICLSKWMTSCPWIAAEACRCLQNACIMECDDDTSSYYQDAAVHAGAIAVVTKTMMQHGHDRYLQRVGCGALYALTQNNAQHARHFVLGTSLSTVRRTIVAALKTFPDSLRLQLWGCLTLDNLSQWPDLTETLVESGALVVLASAIESFAVVNNGSSSSNSMSSNSSSNSSSNIRTSSSSDMVVALTIQESARRAMKRLSTAAVLQPIVIAPRKNNALPTESSSTSSSSSALSTEDMAIEVTREGLDTTNTATARLRSSIRPATSWQQGGMMPQCV